MRAGAFEQRLQLAPCRCVRRHQLQPAQLHGHDLHLLQLAAGPRQLHEVQAHRARVQAPHGGDALVVVDEVAAAVEDEAAAVDLDRPRMVRRMAVHHIGRVKVDQPARELLVRLRYLHAPVAAPVQREQHAVARSPPLRDVIGHLPRRGVVQPGQQGHAGPLRDGAPRRRHTAVRCGPGKQQQARATGQRQHGRCAGRSRHRGRRRRCGCRPAAACRRVCVRPSRPQSSTWLLARPQASMRAARQAGDVGRVHAVVHALVGPGLAAAGDGGLQIDQAQFGLAPLDLGQRLAPDVVGRHRRRHRAVFGLGQAHVVARIAHQGFVQRRVAGVRLDLVDAASRSSRRRPARG